MVAPELGQDDGTDIGLFAAIPGQAVHETQRRSREASDIDRRQPARKVVEVDARNADFVGSLQAISLRNGYVVIPAHAEPRFHNQSRAESVRVIRRRADGVLRAGSAKAATGIRPAINAIGIGVENLRLLEAKAIRQDILFVDIVIDLGVESVRRLNAHFVENEIGGGERCASDVGSLKEIQQLFGDRANAIGANHVQHPVATDLRAPRAVGTACRRVINFCRRCAEIAAEPRRVWNHQPIDEAQFIGGVLIIAEVKEFVLDDWAANRRADLPVMRRRRAVREIISRLQPAVVVVAEKEAAAVNTVRARFERHVRDRAACAPELGVEVRGRDADSFDGVGSRDVNLQQAGLFIVIHAFNLEVV